MVVGWAGKGSRSSTQGVETQTGTCTVYCCLEQMERKRSEDEHHRMKQSPTKHPYCACGNPEYRIINISTLST